jgi:DNA-binding protein Fis
MSGPTVRVWFQAGWQKILKKTKLDYDERMIKTTLLGQHYLQFDDATDALMLGLPEDVVVQVSVRGIAVGSDLRCGGYHGSMATGTVVNELSGAAVRQVVTVVGRRLKESLQFYWSILGGVAEHDEADTKRVVPLKKALAEPEKRIIVNALRVYGGHREKTADALGIERTTLFNKMRKYGLFEGGWERVGV